MYETRVLSGMRPTGSLHLGHYHGVLKNWVRLQAQYTCLFFAADWHALTTDYENPGELQKNTWDMVIDWLAAGVDPGQSIMFIQSQVIEHAELHLLLSMMTPLGWLERVPTYKDQQEKLADRDLATYGFLGYPLLQSADILIYRAKYVPVGEDQVPHVELKSEVARRFNHLYGREPGYEDKAKAAVKKMGTKKARLLNELRTKFLQDGDAQALSKAQALLDEQQNLSRGDRERLYGWLEGGGKKILVEPEVLLTEAPRMPGLDGQKMSKSYGNTISLREEPESVAKKIRTMPTDPARVKRSDPGNPEKCPVWELHKLYGEPVIELPSDLYIPPDALEVILEAFEGPLDLLLYLIRKESLDILDIPMAPLTRQYLEYVEIMRTKNLELAAEYLVMAAMLMEIKSRLLLPRPPAAEAMEDDPRAELVRRLLEYEQIKKAAHALDELPQVGRDVIAISVWIEKQASERLPNVNAQDLAEAWRGLLHRARMSRHHRISREELSVREHMSGILRALQERRVLEFSELFEPQRGVPVLVVTFLALLELARALLIEI